MKVKSKIKEVQGNGTWTAKDQTLMYRMDYVMEDGTAIQASHKTENKFKVGDVVEYEVKREHPTYGKSGTVSKPNEFQKGGGKSDDYIKGIEVGHAINNAVNIFNVHGSSFSMHPDNNMEQIIEEYAIMIHKLATKLKQEL